MMDYFRDLVIASALGMIAVVLTLLAHDFAIRESLSAAQVQGLQVALMWIVLSSILLAAAASVALFRSAVFEDETESNQPSTEVVTDD